MPDINGIPYVESTDLVSGWPTVSQSVAQEVSDQLASKLDLAGGKILQVVQSSTSTSATSTSATLVDTNLSVTITPQYNDSKVLVIVNQQGLASTNSADLQIRIRKGAATDIQSHIWTFAANTGTVCSMSILDSPATTSATTYKTVFSRNAGTGSVIVQVASLTSIITAMEISA